MENNSSTAADSGKPKKDRRWLRRFWALLPTLFFLVLVGIMVMLADQITTSGQAIEARKASALRQVREKTNVVAMTLVPGRVRERINLPGVVRPWISLTVVAEVSGKIVEKRVSEGQHIQSGDVLAVIDARDYRNAWRSAKASYEVALATRKRLRALFNDQLATQSQIDDAEAAVKTTRAAVDSAALDLERCVIRTPMEGIVDRLPIENGQFMNTGDPVAKVLQIDRVKVEVGIPESDVDDVRGVRRFSITIDALKDKTFVGTRHYLAKSADSLARLYRLEIAVDNSSGVILPDMFTRVEIVKKEISDGLTVPLYALVSHGDTPSVFVVEDGGIARRRPVSVGIQDGWHVQIARGLSAGDKVVVVGQRSINDGESVRVTREIRDMKELNR